MKLNNVDFIKLISESLDDINYDDISDDSSSDEFYSKRIGGEWRIVWEDKVAGGIWYDYGHYRSCEIEFTWYREGGRYIADGSDEVNINLNAILAHRDFWKHSSSDLDRVYHSSIDRRVGYWDNDNEELYSGRKISSIEPGLKDNLIKLYWAFTAEDDEYE